jgi:hypothetical protein
LLGWLTSLVQELSIQEILFHQRKRHGQEDREVKGLEIEIEQYSLPADKKSVRPGSSASSVMEHKQEVEDLVLSLRRVLLHHYFLL